MKFLCNQEDNFTANLQCSRPSPEARDFDLIFYPTYLKLVILATIHGKAIYIYIVNWAPKSDMRNVVAWLSVLT